VPDHRKVNRVDMGTADKVCAAALAIAEQAERERCGVEDVSLILLELGGAFTAALAVDGGRIVDGIGGTGGPLGVRSAGALDGEVAYLAGTITKDMLFDGGAGVLAGEERTDDAWLVAPATPAGKIAWFAFMEGVVKTVATLLVSAPSAREVVLSGRVSTFERVRADLARRLSSVAPRLAVHHLRGFARSSKQGAQGAALVADGLAGGHEDELVSTMGIRRAAGTVLDHLVVISPSAARRRLGIPDA
jgi:predicted butyrate kinase (DUF1464 family)